MIGVICNTQREFNDFLEAWVEYRDLKKFKRISQIDDIRGVHFTEVIRIGAYWKLRHHEDLYVNALRRCSRIVGAEADVIIVDDCKE